MCLFSMWVSAAGRGRVTGRAGGPPGVLRGGGARTAGMHPPSGANRSCEHRLGAGAAGSGSERAGAARSGSGRFGVTNTAPDEIRTIR